MPRLPKVLAALAVVLSVTAGAEALSAAEQNAQQSADQKKESKVLATVNGQPITQRDLDTFAEQNSGGHSGSSSDPKALLNQLVTRELLYQKAVESGFDKDPNIKAAIKQETHNLLANVVVQQLLQGRRPTDNELHAAYRKRIKSMGNTEYRASHILVKTKGEAEKVIHQLDNGADFAKLAKEKSTGPSGRQGGDLGWFSPDNMVKPFADATQKLKVGSYTKEPVHTQFGWHVIKLVNTRKVDPPSFDDMKGQLMNRWQNNMIKAYIGRLRGQAKIKINE